MTTTAPEIVKHNDLKITKSEDSTADIINEPAQKSETFYCRASPVGTVQEEPQLLQQESNIDAEEDIYMNEGLNDVVHP